MRQQNQAEKTTTTATTRLKELENRLVELEKQRRRITEGMSETLRKDTVEMILEGGDPDLVMKDSEEALASIDNKMGILRDAVRKQNTIVEQERVALRREDLERDKPAYIAAIRRYVEALRALHEAEQGLRDHEEYRVSPVGFPGLHMQGFSQREQTFADILATRGIDPGDVGIKVPPRPEMKAREITPEMQKALQKRYFMAGKASEIFTLSHS